MKYFLYNSVFRHWASGLVGFKLYWNPNIVKAYDFRSKERAEELARTQQTWRYISVVELNNYYDIKPDPNDDGEDAPEKRPAARHRRGPRFHQQRGVVRRLGNPNALDPEQQRVSRRNGNNNPFGQVRLTVMDVTSDVEYTYDPPIRRREPVPPVFIGEPAPTQPTQTAVPRVQYGDNMIPAYEQNLRLNREGILRQYRPGDMTEYGWYDADTEREISNTMRQFGVNRDDAIGAVFGGDR